MDPHHPFLWQGLRGEAKQRLAHWHIDMHGAACRRHHERQSLVDKAVAEPLGCSVRRLGQGDRVPDDACQGSRLHHRLPLQLANHGLRPVSRDYQQGYLPIVSLAHGWSKVEQRRAARHTYGNRLTGRQGQANGVEACRALVSNGNATQLPAHTEVVCQRSIPAAWAHHYGTHSMRHHQRSQNIDICFIRIHNL